MERLHGSVGFVSRHPRATEDPFDVPTLRRIHPKVRVGVSACRRVGGSAARRFGVRHCQWKNVTAARLLTENANSQQSRSRTSSSSRTIFEIWPGTEKLFIHTIQERFVRRKDVIPKTGKDNRLKVLIRT
jgi:hypothetical protein